MASVHAKVGRYNRAFFNRLRAVEEH